MTKPVAFSEDGARRIIAATKAVEAGNRDMPGIRFRDVGDDDPVRLGKTTATWTKGTTATIDLWEGGTPPSETSSSSTLANCVNKMVTVPSGRWVEVAQGVNGYWYLVWAEPEQLTVLTGVSLTGSGLVFTRKTINTYVETTAPADVTITTTACP